jgi:hypothetical protein
VTWKGK